MMQAKFYIFRLVRKLLLLCFISSVLLIQNITAQGNANSISKVEMNNGNIHFGNILFENDEYIELSTNILGDIKIRKKDIREISVINRFNTRVGKYWSENPLCDRYLFAPSAFNLKRGQLYYQNNMIVGNQLNLGVTDDVSGEIGFVGFQGDGSGELTYWARVKVNVPIKSKKFHLGVGAFYASLLRESNISFGRLVRNEGFHFYSVGTFGNKVNHVSLGLSYGAWDGQLQNEPIVNVSGQFQVFLSTSFLFELYSFLPFQTTRFGFVGMRTDWKRASLSYGLASFNQENSRRDFSFDTLPWISVTVRFGNAWK